MNISFLQGYVGGEIEVKRLESGVAVAKFSVATSENYKDKNDEWQTKTTWHNVIAWRGQAEKIEKWAKKGSFVTINGKITNREYDKKVKSPQGEEFTIKAYSTEIVADNVDIKEVVKKEGQTEAAAPVAKAASIPATNTTANTGYSDDDPF